MILETIVKYQQHVHYELIETVVRVTLNFVLDRTQVHGMFNDVKIIRILYKRENKGVIKSA